MTKTPPRDPAGQSKDDSPIASYDTGFSPGSDSPVGIPASADDGSLGGYTHVVDGAGQSRPVPEIDRSKEWTDADQRNFYMFGQLVPTIIAGEILGLGTAAWAVSRGVIAAGHQAHILGRGVAFGFHGIVEGLEYTDEKFGARGWGEAPGVRKWSEAQRQEVGDWVAAAGGRATTEGEDPGGSSSSTAREVGRPATERPGDDRDLFDDGQDHSSEEDTTKTDTPQDPNAVHRDNAPTDPSPTDPSGSTTDVYIDVDTGDISTTTTTPPPKNGGDEIPSDDGGGEDTRRERLVKAQEWAEATGAISFVSSDPADDQRPDEFAVLGIGNFGALFGLGSTGEPLLDEGTFQERLAQAQKWVEAVGSGRAENGSEGWWFVPGKGGWVMNG